MDYFKILKSFRLDGHPWIEGSTFVTGSMPIAQALIKNKFIELAPMKKEITVKVMRKRYSERNKASLILEAEERGIRIPTGAVRSEIATLLREDDRKRKKKNSPHAKVKAELEAIRRKQDDDSQGSSQ